MLIYMYYNQSGGLLTITKFWSSVHARINVKCSICVLDKMKNLWSIDLQSLLTSILYCLYVQNTFAHTFQNAFGKFTGTKSIMNPSFFFYFYANNKT
ncbi:unnamed protein product [Ixodes pacificus]